MKLHKFECSTNAGARQTLSGWLSWLIVCVCVAWCLPVLADDVPDPDAEKSNSAKAENDAASKVAPHRFREVDDAATVMIWLVIASGLGGLSMLVLIVIGARRMRRMTRSRSLQTQYDELEYLRAKHRQDLERLANLDSSRNESR